MVFVLTGAGVIVILAKVMSGKEASSFRITELTEV
jgi:hypothetical protein